MGAPHARVAGRRHTSTKLAFARSASALRCQPAKPRCSSSNWSTITFDTKSSLRCRCVRRTTGWQPRRRKTAHRAMRRGWRRSCDASKHGLPGGIDRFRKTSRPKSCRSQNRRQVRSDKPRNRANGATIYLVTLRRRWPLRRQLRPPLRVSRLRKLHVRRKTVPGQPRRTFRSRSSLQPRTRRGQNAFRRPIRKAGTRLTSTSGEITQ